AGRERRRTAGHHSSGNTSNHRPHPSFYSLYSLYSFYTLYTFYSLYTLYTLYSFVPARRAITSDVAASITNARPHQ
ncbi:MAG: hypothetical protein Q8R16_05155, partial [bacterium]|nr:hypothetical protein [bacterium]